MKVRSLQDKLRECRLRWKSHISKKEDACVGKVVQQVQVGKRKRGRRKKWKDCIKNDMEAMGLTQEDAQDRALWKAKIHTGDPISMEIKPERKREEMGFHFGF